MFAVSPIYLAFVGFLLSSFLMIGWAWNQKIGDPIKKMENPILKFFRAIFFTIYVYYAIVMLDSCFKIAVLGIIGYGNINYHIATLLISTIFAIYIIIGAIFIAPTIKTLITFVAVAIYTLIYLETADQSADFNERDPIYKPLIWIFLIFIIVNSLLMIVEKIRKKPFKELWDISSKARKVMSFHSYWIFWMLFSAEFIMKMEGLSLLYWLH